MTVASTQQRKLRPGIDLPLQTGPIVVFGSDGCGTRTLLCVLNHELVAGRLPTLKRVSVAAETDSRLRRYYSELEHGQWPAMPGELSELDLRLSHDDRVINVVSDVRVRPYPNPADLPDEQVDGWVSEASALMFLVDPQWLASAFDKGLAPEPWLRFLALADRVREAIRRLARGTAPPRILICATKADLWQGPLAGRRDRLLRRLARATRPLRRSAPLSRIMTVSAVGEPNLPDDAHGRPVPPYPLNPSGLARPFSWHAKTYLEQKLRKWKLVGIILSLAIALGLTEYRRHDAASYGRLRAYWLTHPEPEHDAEIRTRALGYLRWRPFGRWRPAARAIAREVDRRAEDRAMADISRWAAAHPDDYEGQRRRWREHVNRFPYGAHTEAARAAVERAYADEELADYERIDRAILLEGRSVAEVRRLADAYLARWPAGDRHARHRQEVAAKIKLVEQKSDATLWATIEAHRRGGPDDLDAVLANYRRYRDEALAGRIEGRHLAEARDVVARTLDAIAQRDYERALRRARLERYTQEKIRVLTEFLDRYAYHPLADKARQRIESLRLAPGREAWLAVKRFRKQFPERFEAQLERGANYVVRFKGYAAQSPVVREHMREVEAFAAWFEHIQSTQTYTLSVVRGEALFDDADADYYVIVKVAGRVVYNSAEQGRVQLDQKRPEWNITVPIRWRLGESVELEIWEQDSWPDGDDRVGKIVAAPVNEVGDDVLYLKTRLPLAALAGLHDAYWGSASRRFRILLRSNFPDFSDWLARGLGRPAPATAPAASEP